MNQPKQRGGPRQGSGAKPKYTDKTTTIAFRVPISAITEIKESVQKILQKYVVQHIK